MFLMALLPLLAISLAVEISAQNDCCPRKRVGSVSYTLLPAGTSHQEVPSQCLNHCVYTVSGTSSPKFCFATGDLPTQCLSAEPAFWGLLEEPEVRCGVRREVAACLERVRIVGGNEAGCNEWPWQVGLLTRERISDPFCGGALVNSRHIVTAAHCTHGKTASEIIVTIGDHSLVEIEPEQSWFSVEEIREHPSYDDDEVLNDIAVIRLAQEVDLSLFSPVCIPPTSVGSSEEFAGQNATAVGWGALEYETGGYPDTLQELQDMLPIVTKADCIDNEYIYERDLQPGMFCAGGPGLGIDTCQGDSGGPLTRQTSSGVYELVGAVSWGRNCAKSFGVYADLPYYRQWVVDNVGTVYIA